MSGKNKKNDPASETADEALAVAEEARDLAQEALDIVQDANKSASGADKVASDAPTDRPWELAFKSTDIVDRKTRKLITITAEVLDADPALLAHMLEKHPDAFSRLPAPPEETEE